MTLPIHHIALNAHLLASGANYRRAGIHRYIVNTLINLPAVDESFRYTALVNRGVTLPTDRLTVQSSTIATSSPLRRIFWEQVIQPFALRRLKPDLYHALAFVAPRAVPCPFVVTVYDLSFMRFPQVLSRTRRLYLQSFTHESCRRAARVIAISQSTANDLVELLQIPRDKIDVVVPGVDAEFTPLEADEINHFRQKNNLPRRFILFVGTLEPRKNLPMLLRAYAALPPNDREEVHLVLGGGKGWLFEEIFTTIDRYRLGNTVHTPGYLASEELPLWYNAAESFVYPPIFEGFGIPILEAMACAKPVLVSNTSSLPEAAGDVGVLLPPEDEKAWTQALARAIHDPEWRRSAGLAGQVRAHQFSWQQTAMNTVNSYRRAL